MFKSAFRIALALGTPLGSDCASRELCPCGCSTLRVCTGAGAVTEPDPLSCENGSPDIRPALISVY